jgi:hypothetical protein
MVYLAIKDLYMLVWVGLLEPAKSSVWYYNIIWYYCKLGFKKEKLMPTVTSELIRICDGARFSAIHNEEGLVALRKAGTRINIRENTKTFRRLADGNRGGRFRPA